MLEKHSLTRGRLRSSLRRQLLGVIDIGSSKISCVIASVLSHEESRDSSSSIVAGITVIGFGEMQSSGLAANGTVKDKDKVIRATRFVLERAENMAGESVPNVLVNFTGVRPKNRFVKMDLPITERFRRTGNIEDILLKMPSLRSDDFYHLHIIPTQWYADDMPVDACHTRGKRAVDLHVISGKINPLNNLAACLQQTDIQVAAFVLNGYASGLACLTDSEKKFGSACLDMGGRTTSIATFSRGECSFVHTVPMGGQHVTADIAHGFSMSRPAAERLKTLYGGCVAIGADDYDMISIIEESKAQISRANGKISRSALIGIIRPRLEETFEIVRKKLDESPFRDSQNQQVVLTGGACQLPGMVDVAQRILGYRTRLGGVHPTLMNNTKLKNSPGLSASIGSLIYACHCFENDIRVCAGNAKTERGYNNFSDFLKWLKNTW